MLDAKVTGFRSRHQRHVLGDLGQDHGRLLQDAFDAVRRTVELLPDGASHRTRGRLRLHQEVDEIPIATIGRDSAGRCMRLLQVAGTDQIGQLIANRRRGKRNQVLGRQHLGADRHPGQGVVRDDSLENVLLTLVERGGF